MVGVVIVSHSEALAEAVAQLAREMGDEEVRIEPAGGLDEPGALGTDAIRVLAAIERADSGDGVVVLMDLGSAVLSAELALDLLPPDARERVVLSEAPLVEGAVAAAVTARLGASSEEVAREARGGLAAKAAHLGAAPPTADEAAPAVEAGLEHRLTVTNEHGLHARPAARFVQTASRFDAEITVRNVTLERGPARARSLNAVATLGVREGDEILVTASGSQASDALDALAQLVEHDLAGEPAAAPAAPSAPRRAPAGALSGIPASPGLALGPARHLRASERDLPDRPPSDPAGERRALDAALDAARVEIEAARASVLDRLGEAEAAIFDAHGLLLDDEALLAPARAGIEAGRGAARAWVEAVEALAAGYERLDDYQRARALDLRSVGDRVGARLAGGGDEPGIDEAGIVVAAELSPGQTAGLDPALVRGIVTAYGGPTSHTAILARSLGLPAVVAAGEAILRVPEGTELALDGDAGTVVVGPSTEAASDLRARVRSRRRVEEDRRRRAHEPAETRDGCAIEVAANIGSPAEARAAVSAGADGVGLLRTEFLFLERESAPDEDEQYAVYREIAEIVDGRPLILRTLDAGADKPLPFLRQAPEDNPFLGVRGVRLSLLQPDLLAAQLRAAARVAAEFPLRAMFPMVATLAEYRAAVELVPAGLETGVMVEVPATALSAAVFAPHVGFFSVGTNDLTQYTLAVDRGNSRVAGLADGLDPAVLRLVAAVVAAGEPEARWVGVCGELAGDLDAVPVLLGLGVRELSVAPALVPAVKEAVRRTELHRVREVARAALDLESAGEVRARFAAEMGTLAPT